MYDCPSSSFVATNRLARARFSKRSRGFSVATATVAIIPSTQRPDQEKEKLLAFKAPSVRIDTIPSVIDAAKEAMGLGSGTKAFSDDVLMVEILGPEQSHLTLVDLPGLIHAEGKQQSVEDVQLVSSLVRSYMANTWSIILAVVSAKNDRANQIVTKLARDVDPTGVRTLGIITKPDTLRVGSDSEKETRTSCFDSVGMFSKIEMMTTENVPSRNATDRKESFFRKAPGYLCHRKP